MNSFDQLPPHEVFNFLAIFVYIILAQIEPILFPITVLLLPVPLSPQFLPVKYHFLIRLVFGDHWSPIINRSI
jgi:hypothetical protein